MVGCWMWFDCEFVLLCLVYFVDLCECGVCFGFCVEFCGLFGCYALGNVICYFVLLFVLWLVFWCVFVL